LKQIWKITLRLKTKLKIEKNEKNENIQLQNQAACLDSRSVKKIFPTGKTSEGEKASPLNST